MTKFSFLTIKILENTYGRQKLAAILLAKEICRIVFKIPY